MKEYFRKRRDTNRNREVNAIKLIQAGRRPTVGMLKEIGQLGKFSHENVKGEKFDDSEFFLFPIVRVH